MKKIRLNVQDEVKRLLPETLEKNLTDHQMICPACHGLGIIKRNQPFGVKDESERVKWYGNEYFTWCPNCYFGVVELCEFCGYPLNKGSKHCNCDGYKEHEEMLIEKKQQEAIKKAKVETNLKEIECVYDEKSEQYFFDLESFIDEYKELYYDFVEEGGSDFEIFFKTTVPEVLWVCTATSISINANKIIEDACEGLHEDAYSNIESSDEQELQKYLDSWCKKQTATTTYYPDYSKYVKVERSWFDET